MKVRKKWMIIPEMWSLAKTHGVSFVMRSLINRVRLFIHMNFLSKDIYSKPKNRRFEF